MWRDWEYEKIESNFLRSNIQRQNEEYKAMLHKANKIKEDINKAQAEELPKKTSKRKYEKLGDNMQQEEP